MLPSVDLQGGVDDPFGGHKAQENLAGGLYGHRPLDSRVKRPGRMLAAGPRCPQRPLCGPLTRTEWPTLTCRDIPQGARVSWLSDELRDNRSAHCRTTSHLTGPLAMVSA